ncbi:MAG: DNA repair protein RecN [Gammaproteobacteria bacterium]|nr:DNA repair protein RecN [Gammaproteobacteria bacterium]
MLKSIYIRNFAIIDELELDFHSGMSVLTGETGTGKSIIIDALNLALGSRADSSMARNPDQPVEIAVTLDAGQVDAAQGWLAEHGLDAAGTHCVLRRVISTDGKSRAYINGSPGPVMQLRSLGEHFVDIYGQHECQSLMRRDEQRALLDSFSSNEAAVEKLAALFKSWQELGKQLRDVEQSHESAHAQLELLRYQFQELEQLGLQDGEYEALNARHIQLSHAKELREGSMRISDRLAGDGDDRIFDTLGQLLVELEKLSATDPALGGLLEDLQGIQIQLGETAGGLRDYSEQTSTDPQELESVEERISMVEEIARKHRVKAAELATLYLTLGEKLETLERSHVDPEDLRSALQETEQRYRTLAEQVSASRKAAAGILNEKITDSMQTLGMQGGRFQIDVCPRTSAEPTSHGLDELQFLVSTNPGQELRPLNKVASGGELSRLSLAIQITTANNLAIPTLIFDEVDSGVGGATAEIVGKHLHELSYNAQVFCVTHLAQVAAQADHHYKVDKREHDTSIRTEISQLQEQARIDELARMLGGIKMTRHTQEHAKEMLQQGKRRSA